MLQERGGWKGEAERGDPDKVPFSQGKWSDGQVNDWRVCTHAVISTSSITAGESAGSALTQRITRANGVSGEYMGERECVFMGVSSAMGTFVLGKF